MSELIEKPGLLQSITDTFRGILDIGRLLSRLHDYCTSIISKKHPDNRAQYYDDKKYNTRKIKDFVQLMDAMRIILKFGKSVSESFNSRLLQQLLTVRSIDELEDDELCFPDMTEILDYFDKSFNHDLAIQQGIIMPNYGMNEELDEVTEKLTTTQRELDNYLEEIRSRYNSQ